MTKETTTVVLVGGGTIIAGKEIMLLALGRGLREAGFNVEFITTLWGGEGEFAARLKAAGFKFARIRLGFISISLGWTPIIWTLDQLRYWPSLVVGYLRAIKAAAPAAVVHTNWHHALLLMPFLNPRRDIYWNHEIVPNRPRYRRVFRAIADRVAFMVCVSHTVARSLEIFGIDPAKIVVIHNCLPLEPPPSALGSTKPLRLGIVGQIGEWKGHGDALEALATLPGGAANAILKIFGRSDSEYAAALKDKAASLGVAGQVEWMGFVADQREIFSQIDVCLMPSRVEESFGLAALEAGINGRPVICTALGGLPEIVKDGETGCLIEAGRPDQLAAAIAKFVRRPELVIGMGAAARRRVDRDFSFAGFVEKFGLVVERLEQQD